MRIKQFEMLSDSTVNKAVKQAASVDLPDAVVAKFNRVSAKIGYLKTLDSDVLYG